MIKNLTKRFGKVIAAKDFNLEAEDKQFIVLLGPSGCGKTTVLRCIAGLETPDEGEIYIGERRVNDLEPAERDIAMVFQTYALYPHMTVFQNLAFPLENAKVPEEEIKAKVEKTANLLRIGNLLQRRPRQLSGGQRQRVALGRAMVREPQVFLMDEPLSNLDAKLRVYMRAELKKLQKDLGVTTIYVTHDQVEAMTMGDNVAIMNEGILQQVGTANEIYFRPANVFVAGFIGTPPTNLIECTLSKGKTYVLDATSFKYSLPQTFHEKARDWPELLVLGIRPQDVVVHTKLLGNEVIKAKFDIDEPMGDRRILDLAVGDILVKALVSPDFEASVGDELWMEFPSNKIFIFDKETGKALT